MKLQKYRKLEKGNPWIRQFIGARLIPDYKKRIYSKEDEKRAFDNWVKNNLKCVMFHPFETVELFASERKSVVINGCNVDDNNVHFPSLVCKQHYILYHTNYRASISSPESKLCKFFLDENDLDVMVRMRLLKKEMLPYRFIPFSVVKITWQINTNAGILSQAISQTIDVWMLPKNLLIG